MRGLIAILLPSPLPGITPNPRGRLRTLAEMVEHLRERLSLTTERHAAHGNRDLRGKMFFNGIKPLFESEGESDVLPGDAPLSKLVRGDSACDA